MKKVLGIISLLLSTTLATANSIDFDKAFKESAKIEKQIKKRYNMLNSIERRDLTNQEFFKKVGWIYEKEKN